MQEQTFNKFREIIYETSGIRLGPEKSALVSARLGKRMRALGLASYEDYLKRLEADTELQEMTHLIDAISTNVTSFFREPKHFEFLEEQVRAWRAANKNRIRIWCAAASSGEEPYSIAMVMASGLEGYSCDAKILATDISTRMLQHCLGGGYAREKVEALPPDIRHRFFGKNRNGDGVTYQVAAELQRMILFKRLNLSKPPFPMKGPLDLVFCRNVMIYFDNTVRKKLLDDIFRLLAPGGHLIVGHSESLTGLTSQFVTVRPSIYRKP